MSQQTKTNPQLFIANLEGGAFEQKLAHMLSDVALGQVSHGSKNRKGNVTVNFSFSNFGEENQVMISAKMTHNTLTKKGKKTEETTTETPMYVAKGGVMTVTPPAEESIVRQNTRLSVAG